jgi:CheY-like chemotaxis protein
MSGPDLVKHLATWRPDTPVLYVSGYADDAIVHRGVLEPGVALLQKPFTPEAVARKVRDVLEGAPPEAG